MPSRAARSAVHRLGGAEHLPGQGHAQLVEDVEDTREIVGYPQPRRGNGKRGVLRADQDVADKGQLAGAAPDAALQHGDDRGRAALDGPDGLLQGIIVGQGVPAGLGEFADVMARGPDLGAGVGPEHNHPGLLIDQVVQGFDHLIDQAPAQGIAPAVMIQGDSADRLR